jgi:DNA-binding PadR family transcriptional regulator
VISTRTALLLVLRDGPGYGRELVRRIQATTAGRERLTEGSVYPALRSLAAVGLVRCWTVVPGRRRGGRARTYYELTERGAGASETERASLLGFVAGPGPAVPGPEECGRMRRRLELGAELSEAALALVRARAARRRRPVA